MTRASDVIDVLADVGRSHVRVVAPGVHVRTERGAGIGDREDAVRVVAAAIRTAAQPSGEWRLAVGLPGVVTAPDLAQHFADSLAASFTPAPETVLVVSDGAAWQCGAFAGADGAAIALGTGAVTVARDRGTVTRLDGRGLLLGDVGGGGWIGLQALRAADANPRGELAELAVARFGPASAWPGLLGTTDLPSRLARFVPDVAAAAERGDAEANAVLDAAAAGVAASLASLPEYLPACVVGGVAPLLAERLRALSGRPWRVPAGDVMDGLRTLLDDPGPFASEAFYARSRNSGDATDLLATEALAAGTTDLDTWPTDRLVARLAAGHGDAPQSVVDAAEPLARAVDLAAAALTGDGRLVYVGAGTPGRLAVQDAAELTPTFSVDPGRIPVVLAGGADAGVRAVEGAEDDTDAGSAAMDEIDVGPADVVVGIAASGRTPFVVAALDRARRRGAATVAIANVGGSPLAEVADIAVELLTGPEVIAGSTRLAAGTAQKIALNTLSTATMVRIGATYGPWMVDMVASNAKLRRRAVRMVRDAAGVGDAEAETALERADRSVQVALVMLLGGVDAAAARERLVAAGSVRRALEPATP